MTKQLFYAPVKKFLDEDKKYSRAIKIPQYVPSEKKPEIYELCDKTKYMELLKNINTSNVPEEVKEFLRLGATRHIVFNYSKIADFYAHADVETQRLMEQSALVIIDFDDAIANGYVRLSKRMMEFIKDQKKQDKMNEK